MYYKFIFTFSCYRYFAECYMQYIGTVQLAITFGCFVKAFTYIGYWYKLSEFLKILPGITLLDGVSIKSQHSLAG